jgi:hypothetical protein
MVWTREKNYEIAAFLGLATVALFHIGSLLIGHRILRKLESRKARNNQASVHHATSEYVAKYSLADRLVGFVLLATFGTLRSLLK